MTDLFPDPGDDWRLKLKRLLLDLDARIDFAVFRSGKWARELYERFTAIMDRFHVAGWRRWLFVEPLSEAATLGTGGLLLMLALAIPAFRETSDEDWLKKSELAVTLPRPLRQRGRQPRHQAQRFGAARGHARPSDQGGAGDRGPPLLRAFRHRLSRHLPRADDQRQSRRRGAGRLDHHPAARQEPVSCRTSARSSARSTKRSSPSGWRRGSPRTKSSSSTSTAPISAAAPSASTRRRNTISANRCAT